MSVNRKSQEVEFHCDRLQESALYLSRSIIDDFDLPPEEKMFLLEKVAQKYDAIAHWIHDGLVTGVQRGLKEVAEAHKDGSIKELMKQAEERSKNIVADC